MTKKKEASFGENIIEGLDDAVAYKKGSKVRARLYKSAKVKPLPQYNAKKIKWIRNQVGVSQAVFAKILGVSVKTIEAWEAGTRVPLGIALRFLSVIEINPDFVYEYNFID